MDLFRIDVKLCFPEERRKKWENSPLTCGWAFFCIDADMNYYLDKKCVNTTKASLLAYSTCLLLVTQKSRAYEDNQMRKFVYYMPQTRPYMCKPIYSAKSIRSREYTYNNAACLISLKSFQTFVKKTTNMEYVSFSLSGVCQIWEEFWLKALCIK